MVTGISRSRSYINIALTAVDILMFLYLKAIGSTEDDMFMVRHGVVFVPFAILGGEHYRLFTAMFLHFGVNHLANNMLVLLVLGEKMERTLGHIEYPIFYLVNGVIAGSISLAIQIRTGRVSVSTGVSGAIFGMVGGPVYVITIHHGQLDGLTGRQLGFMVLLTLCHGPTSVGVDDMVHMGDLISGSIPDILLYRRKGTARTSDMVRQNADRVNRSGRRVFRTTDDSCIFCKIAGKVIPSTTLHEDKNFRVILNLGPVSRGHALVLPEQHLVDVYALDEDIAAKILLLGARIDSTMKKPLRYAEFNLIQSNGEAAKQTVFHLHMHVIPRYEGGPNMVSWTPGKASPEGLVEVADKTEGCPQLQ